MFARCVLEAQRFWWLLAYTSEWAAFVDADVVLVESRNENQRVSSDAETTANVGRRRVACFPDYSIWAVLLLARTWFYAGRQLLLL